MTVHDLQTRFAYGHWANRKLFAVISQLTPDQYAQPVSGNHGSIRNTMVHMLSAEWGWLDRCGGPKRGAPLKQEDYPTPASLIAGWEKVEGFVGNFLATLTDADLGRVIEFQFGAGPKHAMPLGELLEHAANHGVHHRGQVSLVLRLQGFDPADFDLLYYYGEKHRA